MAETAAQRSYRAPCPGCGAPVEFRSAQSTHAVCGFCRSTVVREGDHLARLGKMADVFSDFSPLQLLASGRWGDRGFSVVGRLLYRYEGGGWTEWQIAFDDGGTGTLSEDNGAFVFALLRYGLALIPYVALRVNTKKVAAVASLAVALFYLLLATGARPLEVARLEVRDYLNEDGTVRRTSSLRAEFAINGRSRPLFFRSARLDEAMDAYLGQRIRRGLSMSGAAAYRGLVPDSRLFLSASGEGFEIKPYGVGAQRRFGIGSRALHRADAGARPVAARPGSRRPPARRRAPGRG